MPDILSKKFEKLKRILKELESVVVAYSGGVDSTFLLKAAVDTLGTGNVLACISAGIVEPKNVLKRAKKIAKEFGADYTINPAKENVVEVVQKITGGSMADSAIATLGNPIVIKQAIDVTRPSARSVIFGGAPAGTIMQFDPNDIHYSEKILIGCEGIGVPPFRRFERRVQAVQHLKKKRIDLSKIITAMPMGDIVKAYEMIEKQQILTAVLTP